MSAQRLVLIFSLAKQTGIIVYCRYYRSVINGIKNTPSFSLTFNFDPEGGNGCIMQFSKSTGYALHALIHLAHTERGHYVGIKELSAWLGVLESYLSKIMSKLRQDGIVRAVPGASGGYELARETDQITFLDVIQVIEGRQHKYECFKISEEHHPMFFDSASAGSGEAMDNKS